MRTPSTLVDGSRSLGNGVDRTKDRFHLRARGGEGRAVRSAGGWCCDSSGLRRWRRRRRPVAVWYGEAIVLASDRA